MDKKFLDLGWTSMQVLKREQLSILRVYCARFRINSTFLHNLFLRFVGIVVNVIHFNAFESAKTSGHSLTSKTEKKKWKKKIEKAMRKEEFRVSIFCIRRYISKRASIMYAIRDDRNDVFDSRTYQVLIFITFSRIPAVWSQRPFRKAAKILAYFYYSPGAGWVGHYSSFELVWSADARKAMQMRSETKASEKRRNKNEIEPPLTIGESDRLAAGPQSGLRRSRASGFLRAFGSKQLVRGLRFESAPAIKE